MLIVRALASALLLTVAAPATAASAAYGHRAVDNVPCGTAALITAITNANAHGGGVLKLARACTYALTEVDNQDTNGSSNGLPQITSPITVNGNNATISRADDVADAFRFFDVPSAGGRLVLHRLTMTGGIDDTQQPGGGPGNAVLVHDGGRLVTNATTFTANGVPQVGSGRGAVGSDGGDVTLVNSTFDHNFGLIGAGVYNTNGTMRIIRTRFLDNAAPSVIGNGGAVANDDKGIVVMVGSTVSGNRAGISGGGLWNTGSMSVVGSRITGGDVGYPGSPFVVAGQGGGIANYGTMTVTGTRVVANHSSLDIGDQHGTAAGILNFHGAVITLVNSPVTDNVAVAAPGGIDNDNGTVRLRNSPVIRNEPTNCTGSISPVPRCVG